jgi:hypothetical protein
LSDINFNGINENFPVAGTVNNSQAFRDNFSTIKTSLRTAKSEIETLDTTTAKLNADNDFFGNDISNANLLMPTTSTFVGGTINVSRRIDFKDGFYQSFTVAANLTLSFGDFPRSEKYSVIRLALTGDDTAVSFASIRPSNIFYDASFPVELILDSLTNPYIIEIWYQESAGFYLKFLGKFDTVRYGIGGGPGGGAIPVATRSTLGIVRVGTGLDIEANGLLTGFSGDYADLTNKPNLEDLSEGTLVTVNTIVSQLNEISGDIPNDTTVDSIATSATPLVDAGASTTLRITDTTKINNYQVGQTVKIFGSSAANTKLSVIGSVTATKNGFLGNDAGNNTLEYKIALFDLTTGSVGPASLGSAVTLVNRLLFNLANNITLTVGRGNVNQGVLIYRRLDNSVFSLIAVLGSKDLGTGLSLQYSDYLDFDKNLWSRTSSTNAYINTTGTIHFPLTAPAISKYGWYTSVIESIDADESTITLDDELFFESSLTVVHDDTSKIQSIIDLKSENGTKFLRLGNKNYFIDTLTVPDNFAIIGTGTLAKLTKLHWTSSNNNGNRLLQSVDNNSVINVKLENFSIDGNMQNQYVVDDSQNLLINYAIDLPGTNIVFNNLNIDNVIGGGLASIEPNKLFITNCTITNSGMTDRYLASPLACDNGRDIVVSNNICKNFSDGVDASLTNTGMISNNIVENCGSGILIVGSTRLVSSPNLIIGPAGEYIPGPDIFNSEFDSVNIVIEDNTTFTSDVYVYQENGELFDLTANRAVVSYRVDKLRKVDNVEELYGEVTIGGLSPLADFSGLDKTLGQFKFAINASNVNQLKTTFSYSTLKSVDANHIGLIYRALLLEWAPVVVVDDTVVPVYSFVGGQHLYQITLIDVDSLNVGARVRLLAHGGTPSLNSAIGEIVGLNIQTNICVIRYDAAISVVGSGGQLTRENIFVLAKGKIQ